MKDHFIDHLGEKPAADILNKIEAEMRSPFFYFDAIYCIICDDDSAQRDTIRRRLSTLGIEAGTRFFEAGKDNHDIGSALSHRSIIFEAMQQGLDNVLVFEDKSLLGDVTLSHLSKSIDELKEREWNLFYLGSPGQNQKFPLADNCHYLSIAQEAVPPQAVAYSSQVFKKILRDIPNSQKPMSAWLRTHQSYNHYLGKIDKSFQAEPSFITT